MPRPHHAGLPETRPPRRKDLAWLAFRIFLLRIKRGVVNRISPVPLLTSGGPENFPVPVATHVSALFRADSEVERRLEIGKVQNLRRAAQALDGLLIPAGQTFSFWRHIGRCTRARGYVNGRQLQEGCLVPAVGGGICQLTNALYDVALQVGAEIVERHPHTRIVPGSAAAADRDATVAWNHIDLRWRPPVDVRLSVRLTRDRLEVGLHAATVAPSAAPVKRTLRLLLDPNAHSCGTCAQTTCILHDRALPKGPGERTAVMVDEVWPEFDAYLQAIRQPHDELFLPLRMGDRPAYRWDQAGWAKIWDAPIATYRRRLAGRRLASQGAARQEAKRKAAEELSAAYARHLSSEVTHLVVSIELLAALWRGGHLGGRTYDVLLTRRPIAELQARLDANLAAHPDRKLLGDYRAPEAWARAEAEALAGARRLVTPHPDFAREDPRRHLLDWAMPEAEAWTAGPALGFAGPTIARKGAHEVREVAQRLGVPVVRWGRDLEGDDFWAGVETRTPAKGFDGIEVMLQPAVLEDQPRRLLRALASGVPVLCTRACGLEGLPHVSIVPEGDVEAMVEAVRNRAATAVPAR